MRVLIAEDERVSRHMLRRQLEQWGHDVVATSNGREAWETFQNDHYSIVVSDWMMPEMDGLELVRHIRKCDADGYVFVILLTAKSDKEDIVAGMEAGADDFLSKPFDRNELRVRLRAGERIIELERSLAQRNQMLHEVNATIEQSRQRLAEQMEAAAKYVCILLPEPVTQPVWTDWRYVPCADLGGDTFGYHWIDDQHFALYLIDVSGHGLDSALLTVMSTPSRCPKFEPTLSVWMTTLSPVETARPASDFDGSKLLPTTAAASVRYVW